MTEPIEPESAPEPAVATTPAVADAIASQLGETGLTAEQIAQVLGAYNAVRAGDPLGTILRNPETGAVAHRVLDDGVHIWRCSGPDGIVWNELSPTLPGWETVVRGAE